MDSDREPLTEQYDIEERDKLDRHLFNSINQARKEGFTFREIVPRLRDLADYCEEHAEDFDRWDWQSGEVDEIPLPGDYDGEE